MNDQPHPPDAASPADQVHHTKTSFIGMRCHPKQKARWVKAAGGRKLARWITRTLDQAADLILGPR